MKFGAAAVGVLLTAACASSTSSSVAAPGVTAAASPSLSAASLAPARTTGGVTIGSNVWTNVSVATLWVAPTSPRRVDAPALRSPVDIRGWMAGMSTAARHGLVGRVETQSLYGERLLVIGLSRSGWAHVVVPGQPTRRDGRGYPGWVPMRQVTSVAPVIARTVATVVRRTSWLRTTSADRILEVSFGTRLPVLGRTSTAVQVATPTHATRLISASQVVIRSVGAPALARTRSSVMSTARSFVGVPYLWGGRSGFAVDCSGFTELVYAVHGVRIPRDADDQAAAGSAISFSSATSADLVFFGSPSITHVGFVLSVGQMLHAPASGLTVRTSGYRAPAAVRRYLG